MYGNFFLLSCVRVSNNYLEESFYMMADALAFLASITGITGAGVSLATTLYQFADAIGNAGFEVRTFAAGVVATSQMLTSLYDTLKSPCGVSDRALSITKELVALCDTLLKESQQLLDRLKPLIERDDCKSKQVRLRILFYFQKPKFLFYRQCLDSLQLTLTCHLASINLAINQNVPEMRRYVISYHKGYNHFTELYRLYHTQTEISMAM